MATFDELNITLEVYHEVLIPFGKTEEIETLNFKFYFVSNGIEVVLSNQKVELDYDWDGNLPLETVFKLLDYHDITINFKEEVIK